MPIGLLVFKHGHVAYQIDEDDEQNKMQVTFSSWGQTGDFGARSKGQISLICQFQRFLYQTLCVFSQLKGRKHIEQNFHSVAKVMPWVGLQGAGGVKNFSVGICDGAPSTARSSIHICSGLDLARTETSSQGHSDLEPVGDSPGPKMYLHTKYGTATINDIGDLLGVHFFKT